MADKPPYPPVGTLAPDFSLPASTGSNLKLRSLTKQGRVVLYFYPKADTPGCTTEACAFHQAATDFSKEKVTVIGVSPDPIRKVQKFVEKFQLGFPLLADEDHAVCEAYGVWQEKSMYGRKYWGAARVTFILARGGRVEHVFQKVKPQGHAAEVLDYLRGVNPPQVIRS